MKTALIFGAAGFVGRYLAKELNIHGYRVTGSDMIAPGNMAGTRENSADETCFDAFAVCDLLDAEKVRGVV